MTIVIRPATAADAKTCGAICYAGFRAISGRHNFPPDFPSVESAVGFVAMAVAHPDVHAVVAEIDGRVVGSNFLWKLGPIGGLGPITVDTETQNSGVGRRLIEAILEHGAVASPTGMRLVQAAYHGRSLSLYTMLGFDARESLTNLQGPAIGKPIPGRIVRQAASRDLEACNTICRDVHGHDRGGEVRDAISQGTATVVERDSRIAGYATLIGFFGHAVAEATDDLKALIAAAPGFAGPGLIVPTRNADLLRWCLLEGLRVVQPLTLMSRGFYQEPRGAFLPSILY